jgi:predicted lipoprotein
MSKPDHAGPNLPPSRRKNRWATGLIALVVVTGFCRVFPPLHIRSLTQVRAARASTRFEATEFVDTFWKERLLKSLDRAAEAREVLAVISADRQKVRERFGRTVGISSSYCLFLRGSGRVVSVDEDRIGLAVNGEGKEADVVVPLGLVFGNAVRDGTGLLDASAFPDSQDFNDISAGLNHLVETRVLPEWQRIATAGRRVRFAGCVDVADEDQDLKPLKLVPILVEPE